MTINLFITMLVAMCAASVVLTEAIKKAFENAGREVSNNLLALIVALVVGGAGTVCTYLIMGIAFDVTSIIAIVAMILCIWIGAMISYDKIIQLIEQIFGRK